jgi:hypothetical protein
MIVGLGMAGAPEIVFPDAGAALAQGKSGERGNGGDRGRSGRGNDASSVAARGNSGQKGNAGGGGKSEDWMPPGQARKLDDGVTVQTARGPKANGKAPEADGVETELEDTARGRGSIASALGALNAAHANENALANASPNSRVGRIAAYRDEVLNGQAAQEELDAAQALLDSLEEPDRSLRQIAVDLRDTQRDIRNKRDEIAEAETNGASAEEIQALEDELAELRGTRRDLAGEFNDTRTYRQAEAAVEDLTEEVENSEELQMDLLEAAANKEVTDEVVAEVNRLLGIEDMEEAEDAAEVVEDTTDDGTEEPLLPEES